MATGCKSWHRPKTDLNQLTANLLFRMLCKRLLMFATPTMLQNQAPLSRYSSFAERPALQRSMKRDVCQLKFKSNLLHSKRSLKSRAWNPMFNLLLFLYVAAPTVVSKWLRFTKQKPGHESMKPDWQVLLVSELLEFVTSPHGTLDTMRFENFKPFENFFISDQIVKCRSTPKPCNRHTSQASPV